MFGLGGPELIFICVVILLLFGGKKIPELMRGIGKGVRSYREGVSGIINEEQNSDEKENEKK